MELGVPSLSDRVLNKNHDHIRTQVIYIQALAQIRPVLTQRKP
jgi:hypothetical protein